MKGTTRKRGITWTYQFPVVEGDRRRQITKGGFRTRREAQEALTAALAAWGKGDRRVLVQPSVQPLATYLDTWLDARRPNLKASTAKGYSDVIEAWIKPHVGLVPLRDLTAGHLTGLYATLRTRGGKDGRGLGSRSVQLTHSVLRMALAEAVEQGLLTASPVASIPRAQRPKHRASQVDGRVWNPTEAAAFLAHLDSDRWHPLFALALATGMRRGELAGLRWSDVDLDGAVATVRTARVLVGGDVVETTPKSGKGRRVDLDSETVAVLRRWRARQLEERMAWGPAWTDTGYVFTREDGTELHPETITWQFEKACKASKLPKIRLHDLRHTHATIALALGVHPRVVQERLGHADISITLALYSHVTPGLQAEAAARIGASIYGTRTA